MGKHISEAKQTQKAPKFRFTYGKYCKNHPTSKQLMTSLRTNNALFSKLLLVRRARTLTLQECQNKSECRYLDLESFLIKPVQRLCKYPLILKVKLVFTPTSRNS